MSCDILYTDRITNEKGTKISRHLSDFDHVRRCITAWYFFAGAKLIT